MASGKVQTVCGLIEPKDVGITMAHEHLAVNANPLYTPPPDKDRGRENLPFSLTNLGWIRQHPCSNKDNLMIDADREFEAIVEEMKLYKENGGGTVVDNTVSGIERNVSFLRHVSEQSGVHLVTGAGYYVAAAHPPQLAAMSEEEIAAQIVQELTEGCDGTSIKAGVIGEIGCSWPLQESEKKVLRATAAAQVSTGSPVIIHPGRHREAPGEIIRILQEAGGDVTRTVMSHLDRTLHTQEDLLEFASLGSYCEWDLFGIEVSVYDLDTTVDMPSDAQRIQRIKWLLDAGFESRITVGHDIHTKHRLMKYGGHGFSHILLNVAPKMLQRGFTQQQVDNILCHNPTEWLTFK